MSQIFFMESSNWVGKLFLGLAILIGLLVACSPSEKTFSTYTVTTLLDSKGEPILFNHPEGLEVDSEGNLYVAEALGSIWQVSQEGEVSLLISEDDVSLPAKIALDSVGTLYVNESAGNRVVKVGKDGIFAIVAGSGEDGYQDGPIDKAQFFLPIGIAVDARDYVYVADSGNDRIRQITPDGQVTTIAGSQPGFADGDGSVAQFNGLTGLAFDADGNLYIAEATGERIRMITSDGTVSTVAGTGEEGFADGKALESLFARPADVAVDSSGNIYVADLVNHRIRLISTARNVTTIAGGDEPGYVDGIGSKARLRFPQAIAISGNGTIYVADSGNGFIRIITPSDST